MKVSRTAHILRAGMRSCASAEQTSFVNSRKDSVVLLPQIADLGQAWRNPGTRPTPTAVPGRPSQEGL